MGEGSPLNPLVEDHIPLFREPRKTCGRAACTSNSQHRIFKLYFTVFVYIPSSASMGGAPQPPNHSGLELYLS